MSNNKKFLRKRYELFHRIFVTFEIVYVNHIPFALGAGKSPTFCIIRIRASKLKTAKASLTSFSPRLNGFSPAK
jgi:hypothetical protein